MNVFVTVLSVVVAALFSLNFISGENTHSKNLEVDSNISFQQPLQDDIEPLPVEKLWVEKNEEAKKLKAEQLAAKSAKSQPPKTKPDGVTLNIDGIEYQLMGIFRSKNKPFILLNQGDKPPSKVALGDEITKGITLAKVSSSAITIESNNEFVEYKLFERASNDK